MLFVPALLLVERERESVCARRLCRPRAWSVHRARELAVSGAQCEMAAQGVVCVIVLLYIGVTGVVPSSSGKSSHSFTVAMFQISLGCSLVAACLHVLCYP